MRTNPSGVDLNRNWDVILACLRLFSLERCQEEWQQEPETDVPAALEAMELPISNDV